MRLIETENGLILAGVEVLKGLKGKESEKSAKH
jgi:hypothetical protein